MADWQNITRIAREGEIVIERVRLKEQEVSVEGSFELPPLARLSPEDQVFVTAFIRSHGSIKQMEKYFGISYPTVKNRLRKISEQLDFVEINPPPSHRDILDRLERGEIDAVEAARQMRRYP